MKGELDWRTVWQTSVQSLQSVHDALVQGGETLALSNAMQLFYNDYNNRYEAADVLAALRTVVKDTQFLFAGAMLPDITVAMSLSSF
jgi:hypothetical protein